MPSAESALLSKTLSARRVILHRIAAHARRIRRAQKLVSTNAMPKRLWGVEATGLAPTVLKRLRGSCAVATGLVPPGRCATTALAIAGVTDPAVEIISRMLVAWIQYLFQAMPLLRLRVAWRAIWARVVSPLGPVWARVTGPLSALIASLTSVGWEVCVPERWVSQCGAPVFQSPSIPPAVCICTALGKGYRVGCCVQQYMGHGLDAGPHPVSFAQVAKLHRSDPAAAGRLDCILSGGFWPPTRVAATYGGSTACPRCGAPVADPWHVYWHCPANALSPVISRTQHLVDHFAPGQFDCLWLRGLLPMCFGLPRVPAPPRTICKWLVMSPPARDHQDYTVLTVVVAFMVRTRLFGGAVSVSLWSMAAVGAPRVPPGAIVHITSLQLQCLWSSVRTPPVGATICAPC